MSTYPNNIPPPYDAQRQIYSSPGVSYYNDQEKSGACATLGRIPYLTLLAVLLIGTGSTFVMLGYKTFAPGLFETYDAMNFNPVMKNEWNEKFAEFIEDESERGTDSYFSPENPDYLIADSVIAGVGCLFLLTLAILGTGLTREICCMNRPCCQGYAMFLNFITGIFVLAFLVLFLAMGIGSLLPLYLTCYFSDSCDASPNTKPCVDMINFGLSAPSGVNSTQVCFADDGFCARRDDMYQGFLYWSAGSFGAALGMVFALMGTAANFAHFRDMGKAEDGEKYVF